MLQGVPDAKEHEREVPLFRESHTREEITDAALRRLLAKKLGSVGVVILKVDINSRIIGGETTSEYERNGGDLLAGLIGI